MLPSNREGPASCAVRKLGHFQGRIATLAMPVTSSQMKYKGLGIVQGHRGAVVKELHR
jgi:hypothetical protein